MKVVHLITKEPQEISKEHWEKLVKSGHSENFEITSMEEYEPEELALTAPKATKSDKTPKSGEKQATAE